VLECGRAEGERKGGIRAIIRSKAFTVPTMKHKAKVRALVRMVWEVDAVRVALFHHAQPRALLVRHDLTIILAAGKVPVDARLGHCGETCGRARPQRKLTTVKVV
jgi:hypothetical protein